MPWRSLNSGRSATRAIVPSSFMISQMTPAGVSPASRARSTEPSVWPADEHAARRARSGKTWPGVDEIVRACEPGRSRHAMVRARSCAEMPVVTPPRFDRP